MPSSKQRVSVTITDQLAKSLETLWKSYPDLRGHLLESIQFLIVYGSRAVSADEKAKGSGCSREDIEVPDLPPPTSTDDEWE
jgi:hypothetical protein